MAFAWNADSRWKLLLAGNRDEEHARPAAALARWDEDSALLAGRDLRAGGTWMGVREPARVAIVTNVRDPHAAHDGVSRGLLVTDFLRGSKTAEQHARHLLARADRYRPFNLLLFDGDTGWFVSNRPGPRLSAVSTGVHGLSNGDLDAPWPKVLRAQTALREWMAGDRASFDPLVEAFGDRTRAPDEQLPDTGVGLALERRLSPVFVCGPRYGTRATSVIALERAGGGCIVERRFGPDGVPLGQTRLAFGGDPTSR